MPAARIKHEKTCQSAEQVTKRYYRLYDVKLSSVILFLYHMAANKLIVLLVERDVKSALLSAWQEWNAKFISLPTTVCSGFLQT